VLFLRKGLVMPLVVYNTLSKKKEVFKSLEANKVKMYVCGPTVYDLLHIGNFRGAIFFNLVRNWLEKSGYDVTYVYNYTDVDDKIINRANEQKIGTSELTEKYIAEFEKDFNAFGLVKHDHNPRVTTHIPHIVSIVESLIANKKAYVIEGEVFYEIDSFSNYGNLSGKKLDELEAGQRAEVDKRKKNPFDFVLWKPAKAGEPSWPSPWGDGRPGWHIECSAMIHAILGDSIDIHGGGIDLIFPHHENEIAQGEGATGKNYCSYWMHNNFINLKDEKMSKSLGNVVTARAFLERYHPEILKHVMLSAHYRSMLNVNDDKISQSISALSRVYESLADAEDALTFAEELGTPTKEFVSLLKKSDEKVVKALDDDFNTGEMMAGVFEVVRFFNNFNIVKKKKDPNARATARAYIDWVKLNGKLLALFQETPEVFLKQMDKILIKENGLDVNLIEKLVAERLAAREAKDWARSDEVRDELLKLGVELKDGMTKSTWTIKK
jgi:cysteinyl-tRNA synthetase